MPEPPRKIDLYRGVFLPAGYPVFREIGHIQPLLAKFSHSLPPFSQHHLCRKGLSGYSGVCAGDFIMVVCQVPDGNLEIKTRDNNVVEGCCHVEDPGTWDGIKGIGPWIDKLCG